MRRMSAFGGPVPAVYDRYLGPILFQPWAEHVAAIVTELTEPTELRAVRAGGRVRILEVAAGSGVGTRAVAAAMPDAEIVATDLSPAMLARAVEVGLPDGMRTEPADAQALPFADGRFDLVVCLFGVMFFPDRVGAYREMLRVLAGEGRLVFTVWDSIEHSPAAAMLDVGLRELFPDDPPRLARHVAHGYHDPVVMDAELRAAGFGTVAIANRTLIGHAGAANDVATGYVYGPLRPEIEQRDPTLLEPARRAVERALIEHFGTGAFDVELPAFKVTAGR